MVTHHNYMQRCLQLAAKGAAYVAPNPMVGSVLVYNNRIIGEGYHERYGQAHAEVNCLNSVAAEDRHLISESTLYVSLEPCAHFGKTPPCADLIVHHQIKKVVIGCRDPFVGVNGKGIEKLKAAAIEVEVGILEQACVKLNKRFFTFHTQNRPYIVLKWAQSANQKIAAAGKVPVKISNAFTNRLVHKWRTQQAAILVGTQTARSDDPQLNVRHFTGPDPVRMVIDLELKLPTTLHLFNKQQPTIVFNTRKNELLPNLHFYQVSSPNTLVSEIFAACYKLNISSILVEGGATLLQTFIEENAWDEALIVQNNHLVIENGVSAPELQNQRVLSTTHCYTDSITHVANIRNTYLACNATEQTI